MKKHNKKLIVLFAIFCVLFTGASMAKADIVTNIPSPQKIETYVVPTCTIGTYYDVFTPAGFEYGRPNPCGWAFNVGSGQQGTYTIVEETGFYMDQNLSDSILDPLYVSSINYTFTPKTPTPSIIGGGLTLFGGVSNGGNGLPLTSTDFVGQVATALGATGNGIYPILALIAGIILALIITTKIISIYKKTDDKKQTKIVNKTTKERTKIGLYNKEGRLLGYRFE